MEVVIVEVVIVKVEICEERWYGGGGGCGCRGEACDRYLDRRVRPEPGGRTPGWLIRIIVDFTRAEWPSCFWIGFLAWAAPLSKVQ